MNINRAIIAGRLTRDVELKTLPSGSAVANFSVAVNRVYTDKNDKKVESTEFLNCVAFGKTAQNIHTYFSKGQEIYIEGRIQTRSWDGEDGKKNYRTEIVLDNFQFVGSKKDGASKAAAPALASDPGPAEPEAEGGTADTINPDDIPF